jgi:hypothetical protein
MASTQLAIRQSSNILGAAYDPQSLNLTVIFKGSSGKGSAYVYSRVPAQVANGLSQAESPGKFLNLYVKNQFEFQKIS